MDQIGLGKLITAVTTELRKAESATATNDKVMRFQECELEVAVGIEAGGDAGVNIWVFKLGGSVKKSDTNTVRIKFSALPNVPLTYVAEIAGGPGPELGKK